MEILGFLIAVLAGAVPIVIGAYFAVFSRRASFELCRYRKSVFGSSYSDSEVRMQAIFIRVIGVGLLVISLIVVGQQLVAGR